MKTIAPPDWQAANQRYLATALERVRAALEAYLDRSPENSPPADSKVDTHLESPATFPAPLALDILCNGFSLSAFERDILLLCAGVELSAAFAQLCGRAQGDAKFAYPTFSLALAALPGADWNALTPSAPLRRWRLLELEAGASLTQSRLRLDERILHYLNGISYLDERLQGLLQPLPLPAALPPSQQVLAGRIAALWSQAGSPSPAIQLGGEGAEDKLAIAAAAAAELGLHLQSIRAADIPLAAAEREALARLWEREALLDQWALLVDCEAVERPEQLGAVQSWLESLHSLVLVSGGEPLSLRQRPLVRLDATPPSLAEQRQLWQQSLGKLGVGWNGQLDSLVGQFRLSESGIRSACWQVRNREAKSRSPAALAAQLWDSCRLQARPRLEDLAQRLEPAATWDDLVLPEPECQLLREIAAQVRQRVKVYEVWEMGKRSGTGLGISALFAGASGTGKTLAAEVLAHELRLDLYRIDLSQVVSKYIGETEKNLRRVFAAAETGGAVLLFDEADALFGKRSEVKDSHDRYANIEVSYLLQRMESYRGLAILTTNLREALDSAFLRRIRFLVQFPFPDLARRREIWRRMFPPKLPTEGLDFSKLARLNVAGGNIRNIALNAAFLAADAGESVRMVHLLRAAHSEYAKLEKSLTEAEVGGWV
jgi:hypothetical protein